MSESGKIIRGYRKIVLSELYQTIISAVCIRCRQTMFRREK